MSGRNRAIRADTELDRIVPRGASAATTRAAVQWGIDEAKASATRRRIIVPELYTIDSTPLDLGTFDDLIFTGKGRANTGFKTASGDLLKVGTAAGSATRAKFEDMLLWSASGGGHVFITQFTSTAVGVAHWKIDHCDVHQDNGAKCGWRQDNGVFLDTLFIDSELSHTAGGSVPYWWNDAPSGNCNRNTWASLRCNSSTEWFFYINGPNAGSWHFDNTFRDLNMEACNGGVAKMLGCHGTVFDGVKVYDLGTTTHDLFVTDRASPGLYSKLTTFKDITRVGGTLGAGLKDIKLSNSGGDTLIKCIATSGSAYNVDLTGSSTNITKIGMKDATITSPGTGYGYVDLMTSAGISHFQDGVATRTKAGIPADGDFSSAPPVGTIVIDTTNSKIYVRTAAATWKSVTVA